MYIYVRTIAIMQLKVEYLIYEEFQKVFHMVQLKDNVALPRVSLLSKLVHSIKQRAYNLLNSSL